MTLTPEERAREEERARIQSEANMTVARSKMMGLYKKYLIGCLVVPIVIILILASLA